MKYSLYVELFSGDENDPVFKHSGIEFCNMLQNSFRITAGGQKTTNYTGEVGVDKTIRNENGEEKTLKIATRSKVKIIKNDAFISLTPTTTVPIERVINASNGDITIAYVADKYDIRNNPDRQRTFIADMYIEYDHGAYAVKNNSLEYYDREAIDTVQSYSGKKFNIDSARSFGIIPDSQIAIESEDSFDFFTKIVKSNKEEIGKYLDEYLSSSTKKQSM